MLSPFTQHTSNEHSRCINTANTNPCTNLLQGGLAGPGIWGETLAIGLGKGVVELEARFGFIEIMGEETPARILVSDEVNTVLIGITVLEQLGLEVEVTGKLKKTKLLLL